jgi:NAD(P)-dependent dehydrogenase (short-subunit alcohol dehydrogenase family)
VARLEEFPHEKWAMMVQVMLTGVADLTRGVLPMMRKQGYGRIVNIGSIHSVIASPFKSAYVAAKHGLIGFSKVMALETADTDITVNTICPSYVKTPLVDAQIANQAKVINVCVCLCVSVSVSVCVVCQGDYLIFTACLPLLIYHRHGPDPPPNTKHAPLPPIHT